MVINVLVLIFQDINYMDGYNMRKDTEGFSKDVTKAPGVPVYCMHGINVCTEMFSFKFK